MNNKFDPNIYASMSTQMRILYLLRVVNQIPSRVITTDKKLLFLLIVCAVSSFILRILSFRLDIIIPNL